MARKRGNESDKNDDEDASGIKSWQQGR